jgi:hypothetical protein
MTADDLDDVNDLETSAKYLRISPDALKALVRKKRIAALTYSHHKLFTRETLIAFLKANETPAAAANEWGLTEASARTVAIP